MESKSNSCLMCPRTFPSAVNIRELSWARPYLTPFSCPTVCLLTLDLLRLPRASPSAYLGREAFLRESISPLLHTSGDQAARIPICSVVRVNVRFIYSKFTFVRLSGENVFQPNGFSSPSFFSFILHATSKTDPIPNHVSERLQVPDRLPHTRLSLPISSSTPQTRPSSRCVPQLSSLPSAPSRAWASPSTSKPLLRPRPSL
jgi:hypothetical protein